MRLIPTMIVEDEKLLLEDIVNIVDWEAAGFTVVATAINGEMGLEKFYKYRPELIITDIEMPVLNGLEMMEKIRETSPSTAFMVLSSYNDFSYVQSAIRLNADDYILKPDVSPEYILKKLEAIKEVFKNHTALNTSAYQKSLYDCIETDTVITPETIDGLLERFPYADIEANLDKYYSLSVEMMQKAIQNDKLDLAVEEAAVTDMASFGSWLYREISGIQKTRIMYFEEDLSPVVINAYNYIRQNYADPDLKISDIADSAGISSSRLSVLFKKETGKTVNETITSVRMEEAKNLLRWKKLKVYEVAERVGYKTSQYFSKSFYQYTGQYPNTYREM